MFSTGRLLQIEDEVTLPNVDKARLPHTFCSALWGNGETAPPTLVFEQTTVSQARVDAANEKYKGRCFILRSNTDTHFMNAQTTVEVRDS